MRIVEPAPYERLNRGAMEILQHIGHFGPIPEVLNKKHWHIPVPISYDMTQG